MARAQVIQGTGAELLPHLEKHRERKNLLLIIPEEEMLDEGREETAEAENGSVFRNGVPLLPTQGAAQKVTMELVKRLAEEE